MSADTPSELVITPANWPQKKDDLTKTDTQLLNLVGWYGSTHNSAMWRKDDIFLNIYAEEQISGFDPQLMDTWDPSYAPIEAEVMSRASVIVIRLENNELLNGSLGSIAEIGLALTSAALRGQIVVISIEDGLLTSLNEPGSIAQYMMLEMFLDRWENAPELAGLLHIHRGDDLKALARLSCKVAHQQEKDCLKSFDFDEFLKKKERRRHNYPMRVLLGGSGGPYAKAHQSSFNRKKQKLINPYLTQGHSVKVLSEGAIADAWNIPYGSVDNLGVALATRTLLSIESEYKQEADVLLLPIMREASSKAAATEIGLLLLNALTTGQWIRVYLEPFDAVDCIRWQLAEVAFEHCTTEKEIRQVLQKAGVGDPILATAIWPEIEDTFEVFKAMMRQEQPDFKMVRNSLLGKTNAFHTADNVRRVRALVEAHLERMAADERFPGFFSYATQIIEN